MWKLFTSSSKPSKLEKQLTTLGELSLQKGQKKEMKHRLFSIIRKAQPSEIPEVVYAPKLITKLKKVAQKILPRDYFRILLREKLITMVEFSRPSRFAFSFSMNTSRKVVSGFLVMMFLATFLFNFAFRIERVEAASLTMIEEFTGAVTILREGQEISAEQGFLLKGDDVIKTGPASKAVIRYLDQSVTRLDENTEVKISRLFVNPLNTSQTIVEVIVEKGRLWARVINLVDDVSRFQVKAHTTVAVAKKKAAFDVSVVSKERAKVSAIQNGVDLVVATPKKIVETTLVKGFTAEVKTDVAVTAQKGDEQKQPWVTENLEKDQQYIETIKQETKDNVRDQVQFLPGDPLYVVREISQSTKLVFTLDEVRHQEKKLMLAQQKLDEAMVLIQNDEQRKAWELLTTFKEQVNEVVVWAKEYEVEHPAEGLELKTKVNEALGLYEKKLAVMLPSDALYVVKESVDQTKVSAAPSVAEKTEEKLSQAENKLLEANDLVEQGNTVAATKQVKAYTSVIADVVSDVKQLPEGQQEKAVTALLNTKLGDLKVLQAITSGANASSTNSGTPFDIRNGQKKPEELAAPAPKPETTTEPQVKPVPSLSDLSSRGGSITDMTPPPSAPTASEAAAVKAADQAELVKTVNDAKNDVLTTLGEAVLEAQKNDLTAEVLQKLNDIKKVDVNGKPLVNVQFGLNSVRIRSNTTTITVGKEEVTQTKLRPTADSETPESPQVQP